MSPKTTPLSGPVRSSTHATHARDTDPARLRTLIASRPLLLERRDAYPSLELALQSVTRTGESAEVITDFASLPVRWQDGRQNHRLCELDIVQGWHEAEGHDSDDTAYDGYSVSSSGSSATSGWDSSDDSDWEGIHEDENSKPREVIKPVNLSKHFLVSPIIRTFDKALDIKVRYSLYGNRLYKGRNRRANVGDVVYVSVDKGAHSRWGLNGWFAIVLDFRQHKQEGEVERPGRAFREMRVTWIHTYSWLKYQVRRRPDQICNVIRLKDSLNLINKSRGPTAIISTQRDWIRVEDVISIPTQSELDAAGIIISKTHWLHVQAASGEAAGESVRYTFLQSSHNV